MLTDWRNKHCMSILPKAVYKVNAIPIHNPYLPRNKTSKQKNYDTGKVFLDRTPFAQELKPPADKWDFIKQKKHLCSQPNNPPGQGHRCARLLSEAVISVCPLWVTVWLWGPQVRRVEIAHERGLLIKMERVAWARLVAGWPATFNAQWAPRKAEVTQKCPGGFWNCFTGKT